ncbi:hypothetical protein GCM10009087_45230 [Sphingomonas oligophenolica]|uniref:Uncharacterized protein n=1 Tax=Sphingomonas oligophenolica TaxID=301154 RepID=A0ABU9Y0A2_9SPHN
MPNFDGGHYFLTVLAPVRTDFIQDKIPGRSRSHRAQLAQKLALTPTGKQTAASPDDAWPSPFSRNTLNHLARFVIIDGPAFNGRNSGDSLVAAIKGIDPLVPQPVDRFARPYLLFAADIDAKNGDGDAALRAYTDALWATMQDDLTIIFGHCVGFDGITSADAFHGYIRRCQVETTMPFNDYWAHDELKAKPGTPKKASAFNLVTFAVKAIGWAACAWAVALLLDIVLSAFHLHGRVQHWASWIALRFGIGLLALLVLVAIAAWIAYRYFMNKGLKPFPTAPGSDLPSVLKSLFVQQHFTRLAIEAQGLDAAALHARFGAFLQAVQPADLQKPTQPPGEFHAPALEAPK